jgi:hypothetical protein
MDDAQVIEVAARILKMHEVLVHETSVDLLAQKTGGFPHRTSRIEVPNHTTMFASTNRSAIGY